MQHPRYIHMILRSSFIFAILPSLCSQRERFRDFRFCYLAYACHWRHWPRRHRAHAHGHTGQVHDHDKRRRRSEIQNYVILPGRNHVHRNCFIIRDNKGPVGLVTLMRLCTSGRLDNIKRPQIECRPTDHPSEPT